ncbi:MAG: flavodoxin domain-containing protein [Clostridium sp.]|uniref:flavodoxin domain-containing protein n=1 Tax=Clostridium sp. TaxID=1506 RepID=UPI00303B3976
MKILILYGSKYGTTEECARKLKSYLHGDIDLVNIKENKGVKLANYTKIIIGGSVYAGMFNKDIKKFLENNKSELAQKYLGIYMCCMSHGEKVKEQLEQNIPKEILDAAKIKESFGGAFKFSKMNFFEKMIIKMIAKKDENIGTVDGKKDIYKIDQEAISKFAVAMSKLI